MAVEQRRASKDKCSRACSTHQRAAARPATKECLRVRDVSPFKRDSQGVRHLRPERRHERDIRARKSCRRPYRYRQPVTGVHAGTDTNDRHVETRRRSPSGLRQFVRRAEGVEQSGQASVEAFIERENINPHGDNYSKIVVLATSANWYPSLEFASRCSTSERRDYHATSCAVRTIARQAGERSGRCPLSRKRTHPGESGSHDADLVRTAVGTGDVWHLRCLC